MMTEKPRINRHKYRDFWVRILVSVPAAHCVLALNEPESFIELVQLPGYPLLLLQNFIMIFLIISLVRTITMFLDGVFPWFDHWLTRLLFQVFFGIGIPSLLTLVLVSLFFRQHDIDIFETNYMNLEWPLAILFISVVNGSYLVYSIISGLAEKDMGEDGSRSLS